MSLSIIKQHIRDRLKKAHYFSDGCAGQYKNCKNVINLYHHKDDFNLECVSNFFATSHGKSACDGIGGTVKRLVAKASLQHQTCGQIVNAEEMFKFCKTEIKGIEFIYISKETMVGVREMLSDCFSRAKTIPGTRSFHQFIPLSRGEIATKRVSQDIEFEFEQVQQVLSLSMVSIGQFVLCTYDGHKWVGMVCEVDAAHKDIEIQFMHPPCPSRS